MLSQCEVTLVLLCCRWTATGDTTCASPSHQVGTELWVVIPSHSYGFVVDVANSLARGNCTSILSMLEEYCGQPENERGGKRTRGRKALADAVCVGDLVATQWLIDVVHRQGSIQEGLLDSVLGLIVTQSCQRHFFLCHYSEQYRQIATWLLENRPGCCRTFTVNGVIRAAAEETGVFRSVYDRAGVQLYNSAKFYAVAEGRVENLEFVQLVMQVGYHHELLNVAVANGQLPMVQYLIETGVWCARPR